MCYSSSHLHAPTCHGKGSKHLEMGAAWNKHYQQTLSAVVPASDCDWSWKIPRFSCTTTHHHKRQQQWSELLGETQMGSATPSRLFTKPGPFRLAEQQLIVRKTSEIGLMSHLSRKRRNFLKCIDCLLPSEKTAAESHRILVEAYGEHDFDETQCKM